MIAPGDRVLVAVSGGKDSLALWDILLRLGYSTDGVYIGLGIEGYSEDSGGSPSVCRPAAAPVSSTSTCPADYGYDVKTGAAADHRVPCSACGLSKRHIFDRAALDGGYDVVATGHNLDDEAAVLLGNVLHWDLAYMARQRPGPAGRRRLPPQGKAPDTPRRAGNGCLLRPLRDRLPGRGMPDVGRQPTARLQGRPQRHRRTLTRYQISLLQRLPRSGVPNWWRTPTSRGAKASTHARNAVPRRPSREVCALPPGANGPRASTAAPRRRSRTGARP